MGGADLDLLAARAAGLAGQEAKRRRQKYARLLYLGGACWRHAPTTRRIVQALKTGRLGMTR